MGRAHAEPPFTPVAVVPDHVVTMVEGGLFHGEDTRRTVMHHGRWTRVDSVEGQYRLTVYSADRGMSEIDVYRTHSGEISLVSFRRGHDFFEDAQWDTKPRNTGERQTLLGESCTVWEVRRPRTPDPNEPGVNQLSCVTDDGIELWSKTFTRRGLQSSVQATRIERRPVTPDEVAFPRQALSLQWWDRGEVAPDLAARPDYETVMRLTSDTGDTRQFIRTTRQHYPWTYVENRDGDVLRRLTVTNSVVGLRIEFYSNALRRVLSISKSVTPPRTRPWPGPQDMDRHEDILAERCKWFDVTGSGWRGSHNYECRSDDGIVLKDDELLMGEIAQVFTAVRIARRPIGLGEVMPPAEMLAPAAWGPD